jgi:hypothetical protein
MMAVALLASQASATERPCITRQQIADATVAIVPFLIDGARERCAAHLADSAFLARPSSLELAERLRSEADARRHSAAEGLRKFAEDGTMPGLSDSTVVQVMGEGMTEAFLQAVDSTKCNTLDELFESLSPLTPTGIGRLSSAFFALAGTQFGDEGPPICPA